jgi:hypothetical protein
MESSQSFVKNVCYSRHRIIRKLFTQHFLCYYTDIYLNREIICVCVTARAVRVQQNSYAAGSRNLISVSVTRTRYRYPLSQSMECATQAFMHVLLMNE